MKVNKFDKVSVTVKDMYLIVLVSVMELVSQMIVVYVMVKESFKVIVIVLEIK